MNPRKSLSEPEAYEPEAKRLYGDDGTRNCILFPAKDGIFDRPGFLKKDLQ